MGILYCCVFGELDMVNRKRKLKYKWFVCICMVVCVRYIVNSSNRAVMSGIRLNSGLKSIFCWTRIWPRMGGPGIGIGLEWAAAGLGVDSRQVHKNESFKNGI